MTALLALSFGNIHNETLLWTMVHDLKVDPSCFRITYFNAPPNAPEPKLPPGVQSISWDVAKESVADGFETVIVQSLYKANAAAILELEACGLDWRRLCIIITDDEVDLWNEHVSKHKALSVGPTPGIDAAVLHVLERVERFFCLRHPYGDILERLLGRPLQISDAMLMRRLVPDPDQYSVLTGEIREEIGALQNKASRVNILLLTKPMAYDRFRDYARDLLRFALFSRSRRNVTIYYWDRRKPWPFLARLEFAAILAIIRWVSPVIGKRGGPDVRVRNLPSLTRHEYMMALLRCHALLGQKRSGGGAINEALKWGQVVMLPEGSFNNAVRHEALGLPILHRQTNAISEIVEAVPDDLSAQSEADEFVAAKDRMLRAFREFFPNLVYRD